MQQTGMTEAAREVVTLLTQTLRLQSMRGMGTPAGDKLLDATRRAFRKAWQEVERLDLEIAKRAVRVGDTLLPSHDPHGASFAQILHEQSIQSVSFFPGFERYGLDAFMESLFEARQAKDPVDLALNWWEADFDFFLYESKDWADDAAPIHADLEDVAQRLNVAHRLESKGERPALNEPRERRAPDEPEALPESSDRYVSDRTTVLLDANELQYLQREIEREVERDVGCDVVNAFLDSFEACDDDRRSEVLHATARLVPRLLEEEDLRAAGAALDGLRQQSSSTKIPQKLRNEIQVFIARIEASEPTQKLFDKIEADTLNANAQDADCFFRQLGVVSVEKMIRASEVSQSDELRVSLKEAATQVVAHHPELVHELLSRSDPHVLCGSLKLLMPRRGPVDLHMVMKAARSNDARVREAAVQALVMLGGEMALQAVAAAIDDESSNVRVAALWGIGSRKYLPAIDIVEARLKSQDLEASPLQENLALLETYARIGGDRAMKFLGKLLNGRSLLGKRKTSSVRACAARALALVPLPQARGILEKASSDADLNVRHAVRKVLQTRRRSSASH